MTAYPGGKGGDGVYQWIINQIPPHNTYIEPFLGAGTIMRNLKPCRLQIGIDMNPDLVRDVPGMGIEGDAIEFLRVNLDCRMPDTFIYCDPPYLMDVRLGKREYYEYEFHTIEQHTVLLHLLLGLRSMVAISGYDHPLYNEMLAGWRRSTHMTMTRGGYQREEVLWMNYPEPVQLHDYRYLGDNHRERERIKKKIARWRSKLHNMPNKERQALLAALQE